MSQTITWLHLSDRHAGKPGLAWDANRVIDTLVANLKKMENDFGLHPDLIFFTGDAAFGQLGSGPGQSLADQFATAHQFLTSVREAFDPPIPIEDLFLVPGNHDVSRKAAGKALTEWLDRQQDAAVVNDLIEHGDEDWPRYMERLAAYREFLETTGYSLLLEDPNRLVYTALRPIAGINVGIGGFNSAWSCCRDGEKAKLWMGSRWQLERVRASAQAGSTLHRAHAPSVELAK